MREISQMGETLLRWIAQKNLNCLIFGGRGEVMPSNITRTPYLLDFSEDNMEASVMVYGKPKKCDKAIWKNEFSHQKKAWKMRLKLREKLRTKMIIENINKYKREQAVIALQSRWRGIKARN